MFEGFSAAAYDLLLRMTDCLIVGSWRKQLFQLVSGRELLELGVGSGLNIQHYPADAAHIVAVDKNPHLICKAQTRAAKFEDHVELHCFDIYHLHKKLPNKTFDCIIGSFIFCSLEEPRQALQIAFQLLKPGGRLVLLEHVASDSPAGRLVSFLSGGLYRLFGQEIPHRLDCSLHSVGFHSVRKRSVFFDAVFLIEARRPPWR